MVSARSSNINPARETQIASLNGGRDYLRYQPHNWKLKTYQKIINLGPTSIERGYRDIS